MELTKPILNCELESRGYPFVLDNTERGLCFIYNPPNKPSLTEGVVIYSQCFPNIKAVKEKPLDDWLNDAQIYFEELYDEVIIV